MPTPHKHQHGLTLVEMLTVLAIIGIIAAIAWSYFEKENIRNRRSEAIVAITLIASELDEYHADNKTYTGYTISTAISSRLKWYSAALSDLDSNTYTITLTPTGAQADDADCASLSLDQTGRKGYSGSAASAARCWGGTR